MNSQSLFLSAQGEHNETKNAVGELRQAKVSASDQALHSRALEVSTRYKRAEAELLDVLDQVDRRKVFLKWGCSSLYAYCVEILKLSESVTYNLIAVMRKSRDVPELRERSMQGAITLSNARRVAAVITPENKSEWLERATTLSARQLEREISRILPGTKTPERASYVTPTRVKLELGLSESEMLRLRRVQDQVSQSRGRSVSLEESLAELMNFYLARKCPLEKAKRHAVKKGIGNSGADGVGVGPGEIAAGKAVSGSGSGAGEVAAPNEPNTPGEMLPASASKSKCDTQVLTVGTREARPARAPIPAHILHAVHFRDQRKCQYLLGSSRKVCGQTRFLEIHHIRPVAQGGENTLENLITLCAAHRGMIHTRVLLFR